MRRSQVLAVGIAASAGLMAMSMAQQYLQTASKTKIVEVKTKVETTPVVLAASTVVRGRVIRPDQLKIVQWPSEIVPDGAFQSISHVFAGNEKRVALSRFTPGEIITASRLSQRGQKPSLSLMLGPGMRAVTVQVDAVVGVGGFITPGDRVDLLFTKRTSEQPNVVLPGTSVLMRNVRVLGIDQETEGQEYQPRIARTVTVEVKLSDAQKIARASSLGRISLALRSFERPDADLDEKKKSKVDAEVARAEAKIIVFRSAKATEYNVPRFFKASTWN